MACPFMNQYKAYCRANSIDFVVNRKPTTIRRISHIVLLHCVIMRWLLENMVNQHILLIGKSMFALRYTYSKILLAPYSTNVHSSPSKVGDAFDYTL